MVKLGGSKSKMREVDTRNVRVFLTESATTPGRNHVTLVRTLPHLTTGEYFGHCTCEGYHYNDTCWHVEEAIQLCRQE